MFIFFQFLIRINTNLFFFNNINAFNFLKVCMKLINKNKSSVFLIKYFLFCSLIKILSPRNRFILDLRSSNVSDKFLKRYFHNFLIKLESKFFNNISSSIVLSIVLSVFLLICSNETSISKSSSLLIS